MRRTHILPTLLVGASLIPALPLGAAGQTTTLDRGQTVRGSITAEDARLTEGHGYDVYTFDAREGEQITLTLRSSEFDAYLVLARSTGVITEEIATDDDSGGGTDSRIVHAISGAGPYLVIVRGLTADAVGAYSLELGTLQNVAPTVTAIRPGEVRVGELDASDDFTSDMARYELFTFEGRAGDRAAAKMRSSQFDAYLEIGRWDGSSFVSLGSNDDGFADGTTDSHLVVTLPESGTYAVRATSLQPEQTGQFTLEIEALPPAPAATVTPIRAGERLVGELTADDLEMGDGSRFDLYAYSGAAGEQVTITLRSAAFDAYLSAGSADPEEGFVELGADDDGAGGTDSRLTLSVPANGILLIRANSLSAGNYGAYSVEVGRDPGE